MCLTEDAYQRKLWGALDELRALLAEKPLPNHYQLRSTAEIDLRTQIGFTGELSILIDTYKDDIRQAGEDDPRLGEQLGHELHRVAESFKALSRQYEQASRDTDNLGYALLDSVYRRRKDIEARQ
jgi:hypothetical protein